MRISIPQHHEYYLKTIASQMGDVSMAETINYLIWELRKSGYSFGSPLSMPQSQPQQLQPQPLQHQPIGFVPQSPQAIAAFEAQLPIEVDEVINRMALLIEDF